ncbi:MAG: serine hydrolase [Geitlerinemataceae cyanobacterium]
MSFFRKDAQLAEIGELIVNAAREQFPHLAQNQIALTWIVYEPPLAVNTGGALSAEEFWKHQPRGFHYRGVEAIYPASVVKLFYVVALYEWFQGGMAQRSPELDRAIRDTIVDSSNDSTSLLVDVLTGTTSGPELPTGPFESWKKQRNIVNRYFKQLGWPELDAINVNQKTWGDGPYGRERAFVGTTLENRNKLTTNATARLLHSIVGGVAVSPQVCQEIMGYMKRDRRPEVLAADPENQVTGFLGDGLPPAAGVWSKAGWMSQVRHDTAYIELPDAFPYTLTVFTEGPAQSKSEAVIPFISQQIALAMRELTAARSDRSES